MTALRIAILGYVIVLLAVAASGCACICRQAGAPSLGVVAAPYAHPPQSPNRSTTSTYDRVREDRHRREVEKQLRDIKRNTQRR